MWTESALKSLSIDTGVSMVLGTEASASTSRDFGRILQGSGTALALPRNPEELAELVRWARERSLSLTVRGAGLSQAGQSIAAGSLTIDTSRLDHTTTRQGDCSRLDAGSGVRWGRLIDAALATSSLPAVFPLNPDLTVGGVVSAGGVGPTSHREGLLVSNIDQLDVVTGTGDIVSCSPEVNVDLFAACTGGLGHMGVITAVGVTLKPIPSRIRHIQLMYLDRGAWLADQMLLARRPDVTFMEAFCWAGAKGTRVGPHGRRPFVRWTYSLSLGIELGMGEAVPVSTSLDKLKPWQVLDVQEEDPLYVLTRQYPRFELMRSTGAWKQAHPWFEGFFPISNATTDMLGEILDMLPPSLGEGHRVNLVAQKNAPSLLQLPESDHAHVGTFAILPIGIHDAELAGAINCIEEVNQLFLHGGGKRYLSGWLGDMRSADWVKHYGKQHTEWRSSKRRFDPDDVFTSLLFKARS